MVYVYILDPKKKGEGDGRNTVNKRGKNTEVRKHRWICKERSDVYKEILSHFYNIYL